MRLFFRPSPPPSYHLTWIWNEGIVIIFAWREIAKPTFHYFLPPLYRLIERIGLSLPRKHFTPASEYKKVPRLPDDTLPSLDELPSLVRSIRRARSDSVGPQSAADAYETLAYREKRRRESTHDATAAAAGACNKYEREMGTTPADLFNSSNNSNNSSNNNNSSGGSNSGGEEEEEKERREVFRRIEPFKPRVRYDVEVVTKLVVYAGTSLSRDASLLGR